jgi:hypothetical protein
MILLTKLLLAHMLGDFVLQPERWVREKEQKRIRSSKLIIHVIIHGVLTLVLLWDVRLWLPVLIILVSHYLIDLLKVYAQRPANKKTWFALDQILHLLVIGLVWYSIARPEWALQHTDAGLLLIFFSAIVFLTNPSSVIIKTLISQWTPDTIYNVSTSLPDAGKFIGFLERILVFTFVIHNHWEAVGFLLAAKSVFRFGNLKESHDRKLTEYVLIGTLLSFGIALAVALLVSAILNIHFH